MLRYDSPHYARSRLVGTYIYNNKQKQFYLVSDISGNFDVWTYDEECIPIDEFELSSPVLGFINLKRHLYYYDNKDKFGGYKPSENMIGITAYVSRLPIREDWRQGLRDNNTAVFNISNSEFMDPKLYLKDVIDELSLCVQNVYPSFKEALTSILKKEVQQIAFHRHFALSRDEDNVHLFHKLDNIGTVNVNGQKADVSINPDLMYLKEYSMEAIQNGQNY